MVRLISKRCKSCQTLYQSAMKTVTVAALALMGFPLIGQSQAEPLSLVLPTENDAILRGDGEAFYQYIERDYQGVKSTPWEGGRYGYVRNPVETGNGIVYTRLHEG